MIANLSKGVVGFTISIDQMEGKAKVESKSFEGTTEAGINRSK
ncbi:MAG: hypothetical protein ABWX61_11175 [Paenisporosarcina sp.]